MSDIRKTLHDDAYMYMYKCGKTAIPHDSTLHTSPHAQKATQEVGEGDYTHSKYNIDIRLNNHPAAIRVRC